ncbi:MAG: glyoxalase [Saprospiraceae bacterium]|nr:glyoxalase [Saprospiraceae bacterium]
MQTVAPNIFVKDISETIEFYKQLGFQVVDAVPDFETPIFVLMMNGEVTFMFQTFESLGDELPEVSRQDGGSLLLYVKMEGIHPFYESIKHKIEIYRDLETTFYNAIEFSIIDNNNYVITFSEHQD